MIGGKVRRERYVDDNFFGLDSYKDKKLNRVRKINKPNRRLWNIDFRGIRTDGRVFNNEALFCGELPAFRNPDTLQKMVDLYFQSCEGPLYTSRGKPIYDIDGEPKIGQIKPYTVSGLALFLDIETRTLATYASGNFDFDDFGGKEFSKILRRAIHRVESYAESRLFDREGTAGARFLLDSSFGRITQKEATEIAEKKFNAKMKNEEFKLKKKMLDVSEDESNEIEIKIVRKR